MENIPEALKLLAVGMITVFSILLIVIYLGKALIAIINKFAPEKPKQVANTVSALQVDANTAAVIQAAVSQITGGKGKVSNIRKL